MDIVKSNRTGQRADLIQPFGCIILYAFKACVAHIDQAVGKAGKLPTGILQSSHDGLSLSSIVSNVRRRQPEFLITHIPQRLVSIRQLIGMNDLAEKAFIACNGDGPFGYIIGKIPMRLDKQIQNTDGLVFPADHHLPTGLRSGGTYVAALVQYQIPICSQGTTRGIIIQAFDDQDKRFLFSGSHNVFRLPFSS